MEFSRSCSAALGMGLPSRFYRAAAAPVFFPGLDYAADIFIRHDLFDLRGSRNPNVNIRGKDVDRTAFTTNRNCPLSGNRLKSFIRIGAGSRSKHGAEVLAEAALHLRCFR